MNFARLRTIRVSLIEASSGETYPWSNEARRAVNELEFVARAPEVLRHERHCFSSAERDHPAFQTEAAVLVDALHVRYPYPEEVELTTAQDLPHPLADEHGPEPAPPLPATKVVDELLRPWFLRRLTAK